MCASAVAMGVASPFLVRFGPPDAATSDGLFHAWFYALPTAVDQWLWPEEPIVMQLLAMTVLTPSILGAIRGHRCTAASRESSARLRQTAQASALGRESDAPARLMREPRISP